MKKSCKKYKQIVLTWVSPIFIDNHHISVVSLLGSLDHLFDAGALPPLTLRVGEYLSQLSDKVNGFLKKKRIDIMWITIKKKRETKY